MLSIFRFQNFACAIILVMNFLAIFFLYKIVKREEIYSILDYVKFIFIVMRFCVRRRVTTTKFK